MVDDGYVPPKKSKFKVMGREATGMVLIQLFNMQAGLGSLPVPLLTIPAGR